MRRVDPAALVAERVLLVLALGFFLAPIAWLLVTGYKPARDVFSVPPTFAFTPTLANFRQIFQLFDVGALFLSSTVIAVGSTLVALLLGVPAGYALARSGWRWASAVAYFLLVVRMVPPVATLLPFYLWMRDLGLLGSWWSVVLINAVFDTAFVTWMMFTYFRALPRELEDAALIDGCTQLGAFVRVALPSVVPGIVASSIFCVILAWNNFLFPAFLTAADTKPLAVALLSAYGTKDITWGTMGAPAHFLVLPMILLTLALNRYFVQGWTPGLK